MDRLLQAFFSPFNFRRAFPDIWAGFQINIRIMIVAELLVLILALLVALVRGLPGPAAAPARGLAVAYTDFFRGTPLVIVALLISVGIPTLGIQFPGTHSIDFGFWTFTIKPLSQETYAFYGIWALVIVYTAYVTEVYRAGIESVHESQRMAARSLGLTYGQAMRYVVVPQAVRRVIPPLLNDFIGLQKDTSISRDHRRRRGDAAGPVLLADVLQLHGVRGRRRALRAPHDPAGPLHRPPDPPAPGDRAGRGPRLMADEAPPPVANGNHFVSVRNISKQFGTNVVLHDVSLDVDLHNVVCLIGASGSGKSTLLRCLNRLEHVERGEIVIDGEVVTAPKVDVNALRRKIGIVFQSFNLFPHMTVLENVTLAPRKGLGLSRDQAEERAMALLRRIGLAVKARDYPDTLSGGQQQRVAIARALAMNPKLMLLDEITSALDPQLVSEVLTLVRELSERDGMTMILATHEMSFAREVASKICFLDGGEILEEGPPEQIFSAPKELRTQQFLARVIESGRL